MAFTAPLGETEPTTLTNPAGLLIGDYSSQVSATPAGSAYNIPTRTQSSSVNVSAILELQSTTGTLLITRVTTTQRNALVTVVNGMIIYNSTTTTFQFYQNGAWLSLSAGAGGVVGPGGGSTDNAIARWDGAGGATLQDSSVIIDDTDGITGVLTLVASSTITSSGAGLVSGAAAGGFAGSVIGFSTTASMGSLRLLAVDSAGDFAVTISNASHGQASVLSIPDGGQATSEFIIADSAGTQTITSGSLALASGTITSTAGSFVAGSDANAGFFESHPATTVSGTLRLTAVDSSSDVIVTISNADHGQASVVSIPDGGQATTEFIIADSTGTQNITSGALSVDAGLIQSGLVGGGTAGQFLAWAPTTLKGSLSLLAIDSTGDFDVIISNADHGQNTTLSIPDGGQATSEFIIADSAGTQNITSGALQVDAGIITSGLVGGGTAGSLVLWSATTASGNLTLLPVVNGSGDFDTTISNAVAVGQDQVLTIPDGGQATSEFIIADSAGTQNITSGALQVDAGLITSGLVAGGFNGKFTAWPTTTLKGSISLLAADSTGDFDLTITNADILQNQVLSVPNVGATGSFLTSSLVLSEAGSNVIVKNITCGQAALATAGEVVIHASSGTDQYKILEVMVNSGGTNFSGGGGDRLGQVTDGTTVYSVVPAASMATLVNSRWGDTATPFPASAAMNVSTAAAADIVFSYSGGATDYTAGSLVVTVVLEKVA